jgi:hypothetical protein
MAKRTYNRRGRQTAKTPVTSSKRRPQRIKGAQTARRTGSPDKMTVSGQRKITGGPRGAQGPANPPVQGPSRRTPTAIGGDTGRRGGTNQPARSGPPRPAGPTASRVARQLAQAGTIVNPRSDVPAKVAAAASLVADYMVSRKSKPKKTAKKPMAKMGKNYKQKEKELSRKANASNFDRAFAAARKAGKKTFTWRGKSYHTRMKGE